MTWKALRGVVSALGEQLLDTVRERLRPITELSDRCPGTLARRIRPGLEHLTIEIPLMGGERVCSC